MGADHGEGDRLPTDFSALLETQKAHNPGWWFRQEYLCEFTDTDEALFDREMIMNAIKPEVKPLSG